MRRGKYKDICYRISGIIELCRVFWGRFGAVIRDTAFNLLENEKLNVAVSFETAIFDIKCMAYYVAQK